MSTRQKSQEDEHSYKNIPVKKRWFFTVLSKALTLWGLRVQFPVRHWSKVMMSLETETDDKTFLITSSSSSQETCWVFPTKHSNIEDFQKWITICGQMFHINPKHEQTFFKTMVKNIIWSLVTDQAKLVLLATHWVWRGPVCVAAAPTWTSPVQSRVSLIKTSQCSLFSIREPEDYFLKNLWVIKHFLNVFRPDRRKHDGIHFF